MAKRDIREGDTITIRVRVSRVSDDGERVTIALWGHPSTGVVDNLDIVRVEKGPNWPN